MGKTEREHEHIPNSWGVRIQLGLVNIVAGLLYGYCSGIIAGALPALMEDWGTLSEGVQGITTASLIIGAAVGSLVAGPLANQLGRKESMIIIAFGSGVFSLFEAAASALWVVIVTRLGLGFFLGLVSVISPLYVSEMAHPSWRGRLGACFQVFLTLGILIAYIVGYVLRPGILKDKHLPWRIMFGLGSVFSLALLGISFWAMEWKEKWLFSISERMRLAEASQAVQEQGEKKINTNTNSPGYAGPIGWRGLFSLACAMPLFIGTIIAFSAQFTGINGIVFYLPKLLTDAGLRTLSLKLTIVVGAWNCASTLFALFLVDKLGRKPLMVFGVALLGLCLLLVAIGFYSLTGTKRGWFCFSFIMLFHTGFEIGPGTLFWIIVAEIFPKGVASKANGFINTIQNGLNILVSLLFPVVFNKIHGGIFFFFAGVAAVVVAILLIFFKETKGTTIGEHHEEIKPATP